MKSLTLISSLTLLAASSVSQAKMTTSVEADFRQCADVALSEQNMQTKKMIVQTKGNSQAALDHDQSAAVREYRLDLATKAGQKIGHYVCTIDESGVFEATKLS